MSREGEELARHFAAPPEGYGIVPFYWWLGDKLTKERIEWQLEKMRGHAVSGLQINYAHGYEGGRSFGLTLESDPPLFSEKWWELFEWFLKKGKEEGFSVSLSDYTLGSPGQGWYTDEILAAHPEMTGYLLREKHVEIKDGKADLGRLPENVLSVHLLGKSCMKRLDEKTVHGELIFSEEKEGTVSVVYAERQPYSLNPMHPLSGKMICKYFFDRFEQHAPGECGKGLNFFFSDELNFGISGKLWDDLFEEEFFRRKHYNIRDYLPCLFWEVPEFFTKVRLDYADVLVSREENSYFKVIYEWHEKRGMTYGCDHGGRGYDVTEFGDYFRTQKYNQGPGCDQPNLASDIVKNKVASSIAHLYGRKRVWLEGFYGSGWGTTSEDFMDAVARNFVMGHNLLSVHGMYYSTHGGWWEWAPPCNTWRMPYWEDMAEAFQAVERMSYMLSQGTHCCDVAVLYPVMAAEGGVEAQKSVDMAFECVRRLYSGGTDVDFIDYHSILEAKIRDGRLEKEGESYRIIVLPEMKTVRLGMIKKLRQFSELGGIVLGMGDAPIYSDSWDRQELQTQLEGLCFGFSLNDVAETIKRVIAPDVIFPADVEPDKKYMLHRRIGENDFYMVYGGECGSRYGFRSSGEAAFWNPYDGKHYRLSSERKDGYTFVRLPLSGKELQLISFSDSEQEQLPCWVDMTAVSREGMTELPDEWYFHLEPCMDNRFGDFSLPASDEKIGAQVRELYGARMSEEEPVPEKMLKKGRKCRCGFGPFWMKRGPFKTREEYLHSCHEAANEKWENFEPYEYSLRFGRWEDPGIQGYHGLKGQVGDDFLVMGKVVETPLGIQYIPEPEGEGYIFATYIFCEQYCEADILYGSMAPEYLFVDGERIQNLNGKIKLEQGIHSLVACYSQAGRTHLLLTRGPVGKQEYPLSMSWYGQPEILPVDCMMKEQKDMYEWFWFEAPPALEKLEICTKGETRVWIGEIEAIRKDTGMDDVKVFCAAQIPEKCCRVFIRISNPGMRHLGACFLDVVRLHCGEGKMNAGDWGQIDGLRFYSGKAVYTQYVEIGEKARDKKVMLEVDGISASAKVMVNDCCVGTRVSAPWIFDLTPGIKQGKNKISVCVSNTLANHYRSIPSRYSGDAPSGILGKSRIYILS